MSQTGSNYTPLIVAMFQEAHTEARRLGPYSEAWQWLVGEDCREMCEAIGFDHGTIRARLAQLEAERKYSKPRPVVFLEFFCTRLGGYAHG